MEIEKTNRMNALFEFYAALLNRQANELYRALTTLMITA